ncbi:hypothetical protein A1Q2_00902 [Trichosporon asahii var. asahii CBS 8904]|uniref:Mediator of RNA polymerase II transcription subunit 4 n=1 Tax=Trichosporon asahii var. asahii (strain CBS 8904) TaxID=1220162 RepID=K1VW41_TRIAC|nr:hypothetical protein A1Q2_00902 [Trichosporon asahii var. asahii CBS 8904]
MSTTDPAQQVGPRPALLLAVATQQHLLSELFTVLQATSSAPNADALPALHAGLVQSSERLDQLSAELKVHQAAYAEMLAKQKKAKELEDEIRSVIRELHGAKVDLEEVVNEGAKVRESIEQSEKDPVSVDQLIAHAHALAKTTSAPVSSLLAPVDKAAATPWPNEAAMRQGLLFQLEGSMSGVGDVGVVGDATAPEPAQPAPQVVHEEPGRRYDPGAVFQLDLNSDDSDDD